MLSLTLMTAFFFDESNVDDNAVKPSGLNSDDSSENGNSLLIYSLLKSIRNQLFSYRKLCCSNERFSNLYFFLLSFKFNYEILVYNLSNILHESIIK